MKKIIIISLVILVTLSLLGCTQQSESFNDTNSNVNLLKDFNSYSEESTKFAVPVSNIDLNTFLDDSLKTQAIKEKNPDLCKDIVSEKIKDNCFLNVSIVLKDSSICENIDSNSVKSNCVLAVRRRS